MTMTDDPTTPLSLADRIERALVLLAYFIELDGDVHLPLYEKFEAELEDLKRADRARARARERLRRFAEAAGAKRTLISSGVAEPQRPFDARKEAVDWRDVQPLQPHERPGGDHRIHKGHARHDR